MRNLNQTIISTSEGETIRFAREFSEQLVQGDVVLLSGDLGMGKSVFCRAVVRQLCGDDAMDVPSPTFTLVQHYDLANGGVVYHFDLYRLEDPEEIYELGWDDALNEGIVLVEWPERLGALIPENAIDVQIEQDAENQRIIKVSDNE